MGFSEILVDLFSQTKGRPTAIIAKTLKGKGIIGIEDEVSFACCIV